MLRIQADLEEAYILSAFRRKDENDMADGWKGVFLDLSHNGHNGHNGEAKEAPEAADTAGTGLPSVESLRATLQALRVQDRLRMEAPLVPTVPTVPMAAMAAAGCQLEPDEQSSDVGRAIGGAELAVTNAQFNAEAQLLAWQLADKVCMDKRWNSFMKLLLGAKCRSWLYNLLASGKGEPGLRRASSLSNHQALIVAMFF